SQPSLHARWSGRGPGSVASCPRPCARGRCGPGTLPWTNGPWGLLPCPGQAHAGQSGRVTRPRLPTGTRCTSWGAPSSASSAQTSSSSWCGPARPSPRTLCSSGSPWSEPRGGCGCPAGRLPWGPTPACAHGSHVPLSAPRMTRVDLRNYLERIYSVPVAAVRTRVQHGGCQGSPEWGEGRPWTPVLLLPLSRRGPAGRAGVSSQPAPTGSHRKRDHRNSRVKRPDYKVAYVQLVSGRGVPGGGQEGRAPQARPSGEGGSEPLSGSCSPVTAARPVAHGQTFTFPDLFPDTPRSPEGGPEDADNVQDRLLEEQRRRESCDPRRGGVPSWFGL
ncbi:39S ribosomal protein L23, mitochondrial, partial [Galemys pyrenaicus]